MLACLGAAAYLIATSCKGTQRMLTTTTVGYSQGGGEYGREGRMADMDTSAAWVSVRPFSLFWEDEVRVSNWREVAGEAPASPSPDEAGTAPAHVPWWRSTEGVTTIITALVAALGALGYTQRDHLARYFEQAKEFMGPKG